MPDQQEYVLSQDERAVIDEIEQEVAKLQQQAQGALRAILRINGLTGPGWSLTNGVLRREESK